MRRKVISSSNLGNTSVGSHDDNWSLIAFKSSVKIGEALDIKHVNFVDKEYTGYNLSSAFFAPLGNLLVDLLTDFRFNFTDIASKKSHEALSPGVDNVYFVECYCVDNFLSLLELAFRALDESSLGANVVVITASGK